MEPDQISGTTRASNEAKILGFPFYARYCTELLLLASAFGFLVTRQGFFDLIGVRSPAGTSFWFPLIVVVPTLLGSFGAVAWAQFRSRDYFFVGFGCALLFKFLAFAVTLLWALGAAPQVRAAALLVWIGAFFLLSIHQVVWLVRMIDSQRLQKSLESPLLQG